MIGTSRNVDVSAAVMEEDERLVTMDLCGSPQSSPASLVQICQTTTSITNVAQTATPIELVSLRWANRSPRNRVYLHQTETTTKV